MVVPTATKTGLRRKEDNWGQRTLLTFLARLCTDSPSFRPPPPFPLLRSHSTLNLPPSWCQALSLCTGLFLFGKGDSPLGFAVKLGLVGFVIAAWIIFVAQVSRGSIFGTPEMLASSRRV